MAPSSRPSRLVGRDAELEQLRRASERNATGLTTAVFVTGEAGVGKTHLLATATHEFSNSGALVLPSSCLDLGQVSPYLPLRQALPSWRAVSVRSEAQAAIDELDQLFNGLGRAPDISTVLRRFCDYLKTVADSRQVVLVVDDLQWADRSTSDLLLSLLAGLGGIPLLILGAARLEVLPLSHPLRRLLAELQRQRSIEVLPLEPFGRSHIGRLAAEILGAAVPEDQVNLLFLRSGGNPFFLEELLALADDAALSDPLRSIAMSATSALSDDATAVLHALSVGAEPVRHCLLEKVVELSPRATISGIRAIVERRLISSGAAGYTFCHGLIRESVYDSLLPAEHTDLHRRFGTAIKELRTEAIDPAIAAYHWKEAGDREQAVHSAIDAANHAERLHAYAESWRHWKTALELSVEEAGLPAGEGMTRNFLLEKAAHAANLWGEHADAVVLIDELATSVGTSAPSCRLLTLKARYLVDCGDLAAAQVALQEALTSASASDDERAMTTVFQAELLFDMGDFDEASKFARRAYTLSESNMPEAQLAGVLSSCVLGASQAYLDEGGESRRILQEAVGAAVSLGGAEAIGCAYQYYSEILCGPLNDMTSGVDIALDGLRKVEALGAGRGFGVRLSAIAANGYFRLGKWTEAEAVVAGALARRPSGSDAIGILLASVRLELARGYFDRADQNLDSVGVLLAGADRSRYLAPYRTLHAGLAIWRREFAEARTAVRQVLSAPHKTKDLWLLAPLIWHGLRNEAEAASFYQPVDDSFADELQRQLNVLTSAGSSAPGVIRSTINGYNALCQGELSRIRRASDPALWRSASDAWRDLGHPYQRAYAVAREAESRFFRKTEGGRARECLLSAYHLAGQLGAGPLLRELESLAGRAGVRLAVAHPPAELDRNVVKSDLDKTRPPASGARESNKCLKMNELTPREHEVLAEVAVGYKNRQIGERLFISESTVGVHLSNIMRKLQLSTRTEAAVMFDRCKDAEVAS